MESLIADLIQFFSAIVKFLFLGDWAVDYVCTQFRDFTKISSFSKSLDNSWITVLAHLVIVTCLQIISLRSAIVFQTIVGKSLLDLVNDLGFYKM